MYCNARNHAFFLDRIFFLFRVRYLSVDRQGHFRRGSPSDLRLDGGRVQFDHHVELCVGVAAQVPPDGGGFFKSFALGRKRTALDVVDCGFVHANQACPRSGLDGHVAQGHAPFHRQGADGIAAELYGVARAAGGADPAYDGQGDVLGCDARFGLPVHQDQHVLGLALDQGLGRQHMLDFGGADANRQRAERAMGGGVRIAADDGHARQDRTLFRPDDMHDALAGIGHGEFGDAELGAIMFQSFHLQAGNRVGDA